MCKVCQLLLGQYHGEKGLGEWGEFTGGQRSPTLVLKAREPTNASVILTDSLVMLSFNGCCWDYISFIYDIVYFCLFFIVSPNLVFVVCYQNLDMVI